MGFHMHPPQGIPSALPAQEALSLRPGTALSALLLVADGADSQSRPRDVHGAHTIPATHAQILDDPVRLIRSRQWDAEAVVCQMASATLRSIIWAMSGAPQSGRWCIALNTQQTAFSCPEKHTHVQRSIHGLETVGPGLLTAALRAL